MFMSLAGSPYVHVALGLAAVPGNKEFVAQAVPLLVKYGATFSACDRFGRTGLHIAVLHGLVEQVKSALTVVPAPEIVATSGEEVAKRMATEQVVEMLTRGDRRGRTALHVACQCVVLFFFFPLLCVVFMLCVWHLV